MDTLNQHIAFKVSFHHRFFTLDVSEKRGVINRGAISEVVQKAIDILIQNENRVDLPKGFNAYRYLET